MKLSVAELQIVSEQERQEMVFIASTSGHAQHTLALFLLSACQLKYQLFRSFLRTVVTQCSPWLFILLPLKPALDNV